MKAGFIGCYSSSGNAPDQIKMYLNRPIDGEARVASRGGDGAGRRVAMRHGRKTGWGEEGGDGRGSGEAER